MTDPTRAEVEALLARLRHGDEAARDAVFGHLHAELRELASRLLRDERTEHTLQPTALVHEAFLRLLGADRAAESRQHLVRLAARAMRHVLVDHARARHAAKRGGRDLHCVTLHTADVAGLDFDRVVEVHDALEALERFDPQLAQIVEMRYFGGFTEVEAAAALGVSDRTVQRGWRTARAWLVRALGDAKGTDGGR